LALRLVGTIPDVTCPVPNGAFYIMPDVHTYYGKKTAAGRPVGNSHELCLELLREEQVQSWRHPHHPHPLSRPLSVLI